MRNNLAELFAEHAGPALFRLLWWNHIDPQKRASVLVDFLDVFSGALVRVFEEQSGITASAPERLLFRDILRARIEQSFGDFNKLLPGFEDSTFERVADKIVADRHASQFNELFARQFDVWTSRIANLSHSVVSSLQEINEEYIIWLKTHPDQLDTIDWRAFERLTGEILASHGFAVQLTGQVRNRSSDILAIQSNALGVETKYLIECKRHSRTNKVDMSIVNAVLGAKSRANVDHAILVTTSSFTRNVTQEAARLCDLRLHLRDGAQFKEWLSDYELKEDGLWLPHGWQLDQ